VLQLACVQGLQSIRLTAPILLAELELAAKA
jgi:hypothetical protein